MDNRRADDGTDDEQDLGELIADFYLTATDPFDAAHAILAWAAERGYRKQPEPEWEYGVCNANTNGRVLNNGDYQIGQTHRRVKAGPWEPVERVLAWAPNSEERG